MSSHLRQECRIKPFIGALVVIAGEAGNVKAAVDEIRATASGVVQEARILFCLPGKVFSTQSILGIKGFAKD
jgi:hypothetical protein